MAATDRASQLEAMRQSALKLQRDVTTHFADKRAAESATLSGSSGSKSFMDTISRTLASNLEKSAKSESTIMDRYKSRQNLAKEAGVAERSIISRDYDEKLEDDRELGDREEVTMREGGLNNLGLASKQVILSRLETDQRKRTRELERTRDDKLAQSKFQEASRIDNLIMAEEEAVTNARTTFIGQLFQLAGEARAQASFETPEQKRAGDLRNARQTAIANLQLTAPDSGITDEDVTNGNFEAAAAKYRTSTTYKQNVQKGEADIALARAQAQKAQADARTTTSASGYTGQGNRPQRNNNPLNIKLGGATQYLVDQGLATVEKSQASDGGYFLVFNDPSDGFMAAENLLRSDVYGNLTVDAAMKKWSNKGYGAEIFKEKGIDPNAKIKDLPANQMNTIIDTMARKEGFYAENTGATTLNKDQQAVVNTIADDARNDPVIKTFNDVRDSYERIQVSASANNGMGDIALLKAFAKMTDPGSAVREEEYRTTADAIGSLQRRGVAIGSGWYRGDQLTEQGRKEFAKLAGELYQPYLEQYEKKYEYYSQRAAASGVPVDLVIPKITTSVAPSSSSPSGDRSLSNLEDNMFSSLFKNMLGE